MGPRSEPASKSTSAAPRRWWLQFWTRWPKDAFVGVEPGFLVAVTRLVPMRRPDQTLSAVGAVPGGISPLTAGPQAPSAPSVQGATPQPTSALSRGVGWVGAARAHTGRPGVPTAGGLHGVRAGLCAAKREARELARGWRTPTPHGESEEPRLPRIPRTRPRPPRGRRWGARWRSRRGSCPPRRRWRNRGRGRGGQTVCFLGVLPFPLLCSPYVALCGGYGGGRSGGPGLTRL